MVGFFLHIFLLLTSIVANFGNEIVVEMSSVKFFDAFDDKVPDMIYAGGHILIQCRVNECRSSSQRLELITLLEKQAIDSADCSEEVVFRLEVTQHMEFGIYQCKYGERRSENHASLNYRFCSPLDSACSEVCRDDGNEYCIYRSPELSNPCVVTSNHFGNMQCHSSWKSGGANSSSLTGIKYCGADIERPQPRTLCQALAEEKLHKIATKVHDPEVTDGCLKKESTGDRPAYPVVEIHSAGYTSTRYNDMIQVEAGFTFVYIQFPDHYYKDGVEKVRVNCTLKSRNGSVLYSNTTNVTNRTWIFRPFEAAHFGRNHRVYNGYLKISPIMDIYKFRCVFVKVAGDVLLAENSYYVYPSSGEAIVEPIRKDDGRIRALRCKPANKLPPWFAITSYRWASGTESGRLSTVNNQTNRELLPSKTGFYGCEINVKVRCSKWGKSDVTLWSDGFELEENAILSRSDGGSNGGASGCVKESKKVGLFLTILLLIEMITGII